MTTTLAELRQENEKIMTTHQERHQRGITRATSHSKFQKLQNADLTELVFI
jgi:hypothetical protein